MGVISWSIEVKKYKEIFDELISTHNELEFIVDKRGTALW